MDPLELDPFPYPNTKMEISHHEKDKEPLLLLLQRVQEEKETELHIEKLRDSQKSKKKKGISLPDIGMQCNIPYSVVEHFLYENVTYQIDNGFLSHELMCSMLLPHRIESPLYIQEKTKEHCPLNF